MVSGLSPGQVTVAQARVPVPQEKRSDELTVYSLAAVVLVLLFVFVPAFVFSVVVMIVPAVAVLIVVVVPVMVVFKAASRPLPVAAIVMAPFVVRNDPNRAGVRRARPVAPVPAIVSADRIPVALHPRVFTGILWFGAWRPNRNHPRRRWRADHNANRDLTVCAGRTCQERTSQH